MKSANPTPYARGTVQSSLIKPLAEMLVEKYDLKVLGGCRVEEVTVEAAAGGGQRATGVTYVKNGGKEKFELKDVDAVVLALGAKGMRGVVASSPALARNAPELSRAASLGGIDVVGLYKLKAVGPELERAWVQLLQLKT